MAKAPAKDNAFAIKYEQYSSMIYRMALLYLNHHMDCEDVMQEVFMKLLYKGKDFRSHEHEKRWVLRVTVNCCIDNLRKRERQKTIPLDESILFTESEDEENLAELVVSLPTEIKGPVHLHYYEGYKVNEISRILGIGPSAVKMRLKKGRDMLRGQLEDK